MSEDPGSGKFSEARLTKYQNAGYRVVGEHKHSGVEICRWTKSRLKGKRNCYKAVYGVKSHRCVQMTPALDFCTFSCKFCWRSFGPDRNKASRRWDTPKDLVDAMILAQQKLLSGFGGNPLTPQEYFQQAQDPAHFAISLDGEPTLYPYIAELILEIKKRGATAFLVTNGTVPEKLQELLDKKAQPTNIYLSVYATNAEDYKKITNAFIGKPFEVVLRSLELLKKFDEARTIFRMTLVRGENMKDPEGFAVLAKKTEPDFIEMKGYSWLGESKERLPISAMPTIEEMDAFASIIAKETGYVLKARDVTSRVLILCKDEETWKWSLGKIKEQDSYFEETKKKLKEEGKKKQLSTTILK